MLGVTTYGDDAVASQTNAGGGAGGGGGIGGALAGLISRRMQQMDEDRAYQLQQRQLQDRLSKNARAAALGTKRTEAPGAIGKNNGRTVVHSAAPGARRQAPALEDVFVKNMGGSGIVGGMVEVAPGTPGAVFGGTRAAGSGGGKATFSNLPSDAIGGAKTAAAPPPADPIASQPGAAQNGGGAGDATSKWFELPAWYRQQILARQAAGGGGGDGDAMPQYRR